MMKSLLSLILTVIFILCIQSCADTEGWGPPFPYELLDTDPEAAYSLAMDLKEESEKNNDLSGLVEASYLLGSINYKKGKYDEALLHYLEAIHYGETDPRMFADNLIYLYKNCGVIYMRANSHRLAKESYEKGIRLAEASGNSQHVIGFRRNLSFVYAEMNQFDQSITILREALRYSEQGSKKYFELLNSLAIRYEAAQQYDLSISTLHQLLDELPTDQLKLRGYAYHNIARVYKSLEEPGKSLEWYQKAIIEKKKIAPDNPTLFSSFFGIGEVYSMLGNLERAKKYLSEAETFITGEKRLNPGYFELYRVQATLFQQLGDEENRARYQERYSACRNEQEAVRDRMEKEVKSRNVELLTEQATELIKLKEEKKAREQGEERSQQKWINIGLIILSGLMFLTMIAVIVYKNYRQKVIFEVSLELVKEAQKSAGTGKFRPPESRFSNGSDPFSDN